MSLEEFLSYIPPSYKTVLHTLSVNLEWNIVDAYQLIDYVCYIMTLLENDDEGKYTDLYGFLEKKETYLELHKDLDELMDKYKFIKSDKDYGNYSEVYNEQLILHYFDNLEHADMLVARDNAWRNILLYDEY